MKVRLKQPVLEARQWDGDLAAMEAWLKAHAVLHVHVEPERLNPERLRAVGVRFTFSLAVGDWLVAYGDSSLWKVCRKTFDDLYERVDDPPPAVKAGVA